MIERGLLTISHVRYVVLDEADEMLDSGFSRPLSSASWRSRSVRR